MLTLIEEVLLLIGSILVSFTIGYMVAELEDAKRHRLNRKKFNEEE